MESSGSAELLYDMLADFLKPLPCHRPDTGRSAHESNRQYQK